MVHHRETQASYVHTRSREVDDTYGRAPTQTQQYMPQQYLSTGGAMEVPMSGIDPSGVQGLLAQNAIRMIDSRIRNFEEMKDQASDLASWVSTSTGASII